MKKPIILAAALTLSLAATAQKSVILLIGDGMGVAQLSALMEAETEMTAFEYFPVAGLVSTCSANNRVTDSAAAATAYATGEKTNNGYLSVDPETGEPLITILEQAKGEGMATGLVATTYLEHATPAAFYAHVKSRNDREEIARQLAAANIDFAKGEVSDLAAETRAALEVMDADEDGFFLMVEGSLIDSAGHSNDPERLLEEMRGFEAAVRVAHEYAAVHPQTLVIVTADHETGGLTLPSGDENFLLPDSGLSLEWSTKGHTAALVPLFAVGPNAERFGAIHQNISIHRLIQEFLEVQH